MRKAIWTPRLVRLLGFGVIAILIFLCSYFFIAGTVIDISHLVSELRQQQSLSDIQERQQNNLAANRELVENFKRYKLVPLEQVTKSVLDISRLAKSNSLRETVFKLSRHESVREGTTVMSLTGVSIRAEGSFANIMDYVKQLTEGETYYFLETVRIGTKEDSPEMSVEISCNILGFGENISAAELPKELSENYLFSNPFNSEEGEAYEQ